jgi:hypothetical protein
MVESITDNLSFDKLDSGTIACPEPFDFAQDELCRRGGQGALAFSSIFGYNLTEIAFEV